MSLSPAQPTATQVPAPIQPFRLLDLPVELRFMIYERLSSKSHHSYSQPIYFSLTKTQSPQPTTLSTTLSPASNTTTSRPPSPSSPNPSPSLSLSLLATCHQIHAEALPILSPAMAQLRLEPLRFIIDRTSLEPCRASCSSQPGSPRPNTVLRASKTQCRKPIRSWATASRPARPLIATWLLSWK
jgi:hypothetical protein